MKRRGWARYGESVQTTALKLNGCVSLELVNMYHIWRIKAGRGAQLVLLALTGNNNLS